VLAVVSTEMRAKNSARGLLLERRQQRAPACPQLSGLAAFLPSVYFQVSAFLLSRRSTPTETS
jgi:hypothetical protein